MLGFSPEQLAHSASRLISHLYGNPLKLPLE
jgi:hypothetical protein